MGSGDRDFVVLRSGPGFLRHRHPVRPEAIACLKPETKAVVVDAAVLSSVDVTGARMLDSLIEELEHRGIRVFVAREIGQVRDFLGKVGGETQV